MKTSISALDRSVEPGVYLQSKYRFRTDFESLDWVQSTRPDCPDSAYVLKSETLPGTTSNSSAFVASGMGRTILAQAQPLSIGPVSRPSFASCHLRRPCHGSSRACLLAGSVRIAHFPQSGHHSTARRWKGSKWASLW